MTYFPDLGTESLVASGPQIRAIGWLSAHHGFATGSSDHEFRSKLQALCSDWEDSTSALGWPIAAGWHDCELCSSFRAGGNLGVPGNGVLFVAPQMVAHYVNEHDYLPPMDFVTAVRSCPVLGSPEYALLVQELR